MCSEHRLSIDPTITQKINDINLKNNAQHYLQKLKKIAVALDIVQKDTCTIGESTEIWIKLLLDFEEFEESDRIHYKKRFDMAMTPAHFLANLLDHRFRRANLTQEQLDSALEYATSYYPAAMPHIINYRAKITPFKEYLFLLT